MTESTNQPPARPDPPARVTVVDIDIDMGKLIGLAIKVGFAAAIGGAIVWGFFFVLAMLVGIPMKL